MPPVIPLLVAHVADDSAMTVTIDDQPHEPEAFAPPWMRHHLVPIVNDIIGERNAPVRVVIHEADGSTFDDIIAERIEAEVPLVPAAPVLDAAPHQLSADDEAGFLDGEEVAVAVIVRHVRAQLGGTVPADLDLRLVGATGAGEVLLFGRTSATCAVRSLP